MANKLDKIYARVYTYLMIKTTVDLTHRVLYEDENGRWTMDDPVFGLTAEPIYIADAQDMIRKAGKRELFAELFPMANWERMMRRTF